MEDIAAVVKRSWWRSYLFFPSVRGNLDVAENMNRGR
jgi:hypothetical protein